MRASLNIDQRGARHRPAYAPAMAKLDPTASNGRQQLCDRACPRSSFLRAIFRRAGNPPHFRPGLTKLTLKLWLDHVVSETSWFRRVGPAVDGADRDRAWTARGTGGERDEARTAIAVDLPQRRDSVTRSEGVLESRQGLVCLATRHGCDALGVLIE